MSSAVKISLIVAADLNDVIGAGGELPWHLPEDLKRFRRLTTGHVVVAGRRTHESIVHRLGHPLTRRITVVVSRTPRPNRGSVLFQTDLPSALEVARAIESFADRDEVFVIGGAQVYAQVIDQVSRVYLTRVHRRVAGDVTMPKGWLRGFELREEDVRPEFTFQTYERG